MVFAKLLQLVHTTINGMRGVNNSSCDYTCEARAIFDCTTPLLSIDKPVSSNTDSLTDELDLNTVNDTKGDYVRYISRTTQYKTHNIDR